MGILEDIYEELAMIREELIALRGEKEATGVDAIDPKDHTVYKFAVGDMLSPLNGYMAGPFNSYHEAAQVDAGVVLEGRGMSVKSHSMHIYKLTGSGRVDETVAWWDEHDCRWVAC
jgi:hypothetical protein